MKNGLVFAAALLLGSVSVTAQEAGGLSREVTVEKSYSPQVDNAVKITGVPEVEDPLVEKPLAEFSSWAVPMMGSPRTQPLPASLLATQEPFDKKWGYAQFGIGNNLNIRGDAGLRLLNTSADQLGIWYNHYSTGGRLSYLDPPAWSADKVYQHQNSNTVNLTYKHLFKKVEWRTAGAYRSNTFNYYGFSLQPLPVMEGEDTQRASQYAVSTAVRSVKDELVVFDASVGFEGFRNRIGYLTGTDGGVENHLETRLSLAVALSEGSRHRLGFDVKLDNLFYRRTGARNYTVFSFTPFYKYASDKIRFRAGAKMDVSAHDGTVFRFAPDVEFNVDFGKSFHFYTVVDGGKELNTWSRMSSRNIYLNPTERLASTYTPVNALAGLYCDYLPGFKVRGFVGVKSSVSALFDMRRREMVVNGMIASHEVVDYVPLDAFRVLGGVNMEYNLSNILKGEVRWVYNGWMTRGERDFILSSLPRNEWYIDLGVYPVKALAIKAMFYIGSGRGYRCDYPDAGLPQTRMSDIYELNLSVDYNITKMLRVFAQGNNLLSQHYDIYYGMPAQRINFLVGMGVDF